MHIHIHIHIHSVGWKTWFDLIFRPRVNSEGKHGRRFWELQAVVPTSQRDNGGVILIPKTEANPNVWECEAERLLSNTAQREEACLRATHVRKQFATFT